MGVRMVGERRSPGVEHGGEPDACAEMLGIGRDRDQGLGSDFQQQVIDDRLILIGDVGDWSRQGEHDMEIGHRQEFGLAVGQPFLGSGGLALWAVPVAARVVRDAQVRAVFAAFDIPPNAAVRQRSIADMTLSWPRLTWPAWDARQAGPRWRKMSATSTAGRDNGRASAGHLPQKVERAGHLADRTDGDASVERRRVEFLMSQ